MNLLHARPIFWRTWATVSFATARAFSAPSAITLSTYSGFASSSARLFCKGSSSLKIASDNWFFTSPYLTPVVWYCFSSSPLLSFHSNSSTNSSKLLTPPVTFSPVPASVGIFAIFCLIVSKSSVKLM